MPGALPVPNKKAVEWTIKISKALGCKINTFSKFDRKHYFYPDLPKGYQISQYDFPIGYEGKVEIKKKDGSTKMFRITRVHLEEDTGKLMHSGEDTLVDFNRSSVPLVEIVTEPDFDNSEDVQQFLEELHAIIRYLDVSDADMEKGSMRMEPNISLKKVGEKELPNYKVEVKNINSFNFAKKAIDYELKRHAEILDRGETPAQETRGYNDAKGITFSQRSKENAHDYRYFPEPDIPPMHFADSYISDIEKTLPQLPADMMNLFMTTYNVSFDNAFILSRNKTKAKKAEQIFIEASKNSQIENFPQQVANMLINKRISIDEDISVILKKATELLAPKETDTGKLSEVIEKLLTENPKVITDYKSGKTNAIMFLIGLVMKEMKGQADPGVVRNALIEKVTAK
jgi:aspartyl-tRNA(Asn)/glutamyl-tRNA(Gln) amidotransferase subunit B